MPAASKSVDRSRDLRAFAIRAFFESVLGLIGVFVLAAVAAPALFNIRNNLAVAAAVLVWIVCPVLLYLLANHVVGGWRRLKQGPRP